MILDPVFQRDGMAARPERSEGSPCGSLKSLLSFLRMVEIAVEILCEENEQESIPKPPLSNSRPWWARGLTL